MPHTFASMGSYCRIGYLYGHFDEEKKAVTVECIYEPPQDNTDVSFNLLEDPRAVLIHATQFTITHYLDEKAISTLTRPFVCKAHGCFPFHDFALIVVMLCHVYRI